MRKDLIIIGVLVLIVFAGAVLFGSYFGSRGPSTAAGLKLGESKEFDGVIVKPISLIEDSRCAEGVQCVWAGTVRVNTEIRSGLGTATETVELGKPITTEAEEVTLVSVTPAPMQGETIDPEDYYFNFDVKKRSLVDVNPGATGGCYVGGCSGQICSDEPGMVSTCEYREGYACYRTARCERQASGQCGWTETQELRMCLNNAQGENTEPVF